MKVFGVREELGEDKVKWRQMVCCANASYPQKKEKAIFFASSKQSRIPKVNL